jgi:hypothetical protein
MKSVVCPIQSNSSRFFPIIHHNVKGTHHRYNELMKRFVCMGTPSLSAGNVIQIKDSLDLKRHLYSAIDGRNRAFAFTDFGQFNDVAVINRSFQRLRFIL